MESSASEHAGQPGPTALQPINGSKDEDYARNWSTRRGSGRGLRDADFMFTELFIVTEASHFHSLIKRTQLPKSGAFSCLHGTASNPFQGANMSRPCMDLA
jgi:hypothetical protein